MPASEFLTTQTMGGYIVVLAIAGGLSYYYMAGKTKSNAAKGAKSFVEPRKENNAKKQRQAAFASTAQKPTPADKPSSTDAPSAWLTNNPDGVDNKEFAKRMTTAKEGKKFDNKSTGEQKKRQKSVKQSRAAEKDVETKPVEAAEALENKAAAAAAPAPVPVPTPAVEPVEADDEDSPAASPEIAPADPSGVSDMLEPTATGPSVLRLTGTDKEKTKAKNQKAPEKAETKKQRQNRQKNEAKKIAREEEEKERKVKLENQRRTAREAAGIPAKDGSQFLAGVNGNKSAWTAGSPNGASSTNGASPAVQPLDTFDAPAKNGTTATAANTVAPTQTSDSWISSLPSEEEQMERLKEDADEWNTVKTKASKKAKKEAKASSPEPAAAPTPAPAAISTQSRPIAQAVQKPAASNGKAAKPAQSYGSFSALSTDEKEEEWDV